MTVSETATVLAWHDALNAADVDTLLSLSSEGIAFGDANGAAQGRLALRDWLGGLQVNAQLGRMYVHDDVVVVEQTLSRANDPAGTTSAASAFRVVDDHVTSVFRHDDLASALAATELTEADRTD